MGFPLILGAIGAGVSAVGTIESGIAQSQAAGYQAQVARNNATIANQNATYASEAGAAQATKQSLQGAALGGRIKASQAANNIDVNSGSAVKVQQGQREASELDTLTTENNALLQAYGYHAAASGDEAQAGLLQSESDQAIPGAVLGAGGSLLGNASSLGFKWSSMQDDTAGGTGSGF